MRSGTTHSSRASRSLDVVYLPAERRLDARPEREVDMKTLDATTGFQSARDVRTNALANAGRLDENEFQKFTSALCIAAHLPDEPGIAAHGFDEPAKAWADFKAAADQLLEPKRLLPLTRSRPDEL